MNFFIKNRKSINIVTAIGSILDIIIAILINKISSEEFNLLSVHNILCIVFLVIFAILFVCCQIITQNSSVKIQIQKHQLRKAFKENGGYEAVVDEMKRCIENHDYKSIKKLKKTVEYIER